MGGDVYYGITGDLVSKLEAVYLAVSPMGTWGSKYQLSMSRIVGNVLMGLYLWGMAQLLVLDHTDS